MENHSIKMKLLLMYSQSYDFERPHFKSVLYCTTGNRVSRTVRGDSTLFCAYFSKGSAWLNRQLFGWIQAIHMGRNMHFTPENEKHFDKRHLGRSGRACK